MKKRKLCIRINLIVCAVIVVLLLGGRGKIMADDKIVFYDDSKFYTPTKRELIELELRNLEFKEKGIDPARTLLKIDGVKFIEPEENEKT